MAELRPQPFAVLLARMLEEHRRQKTIFDLEERHFWKGDPALDLSVSFHGERAGNASGPAAGPQSQLAQNLVLSYLAGARIFELKTVQVNDRLKIPRPCIDAANVGFNVEWSQELLLADSLSEYLSGWYLVHILRSLGFGGAAPGAGELLFDLSVGYDLAGIQSDPVARWLDTTQDARLPLAKLRASLPPALARFADVEVPARVSACVTLSTFHGCPAGEIERIVEHLLTRHGVHVVVKLNPTLLGYEQVETLLREKMGYQELRLSKKHFDDDLRWNDALAMFSRLEAVATRVGRTLGAKFTNTLVVWNHKSFFADDVMYLSGQPLHVLATTLAARFADATLGRFPCSFSAGIDQKNFFEAVACGMAPVTACTDLLRPGGYARLPRYLEGLQSEMRRTGTHDVAGYVMARAKERGEPARAPDAAAQTNLQAYAARLPADPRYHAAKNRAVPRRVGSHLVLFDCVSCDKCVAVCPQDANFAIESTPAEHDAPELVFQSGVLVESRPGRFSVKQEQQWANYADFCNECGNCDVFCPEDGGPYKVKPRFFGSKESFEATPNLDGFYFEEGGAAMVGRIEGEGYRLREEGGRAKFSDAVAEVELDLATGKVLAAPARGRGEHVLPLWRLWAMRLLRQAVLSRVNAASAPFVSATPPTPAA